MKSELDAKVAVAADHPSDVGPPLTTAVVVVTYERPDYVAKCLAHLSTQTLMPTEILVVDASRDDRTRHLVEELGTARYIKNHSGYGHMTQSRNIGYRQSTAEIVAYLDDDSFAEPNWLSSVVAVYDECNVGAVGGRALNGRPGEAFDGQDQIGQLLHDGSITGNFAADPGQRVDVDHLIGCNMTYRRSVLDQLGGFAEDFPGTALREDTHMGLRVGAAGYRVVFEPLAVVYHVGAPHSKGQRFDLRYSYYGHRNHIAMLVRTFGLTGIVSRYLYASTRGEIRAATRRLGSAVFRFAVFLVGTGVGLTAGLRLRSRDRRPDAKNEN